MDSEDRTIDLPPQRVQPGVSEILITIDPPPGHEFNPSAPFELHAKSFGTAVELDPEATRLIETEPLFPHAITCRLGHGEDRVDLDIVAYYCETGESKVCYYQHVRLNQPVTVDELADDQRIAISFRLGIPEVTEN